MIDIFLQIRTCLQVYEYDLSEMTLLSWKGLEYRTLDIGMQCAFILGCCLRASLLKFREQIHRSLVSALMLFSKFPLLRLLLILLYIAVVWYGSDCGA